MEKPIDRSSRPRHNPTLRFLAELPILAAIALALLFVIKSFIAQPYYIPSGSMEPQLHIGDRVLVSKLAYQLHDPHRGDIIVFPSPADAGKGDQGTIPGKLVRGVLEAIGLREPSKTILIKRVVGLPGETVQGKGGHVYINGQLLIEPYLSNDVYTDDFGPVTVPDHDLWVMGDNRGNSEDSRFPEIGPIKEATVIGRAIMKVWPPGHTSFL